jgi:hypothetical protein
MPAANSKSDHVHALAMHRALDTSRDIGPISKARSSSSCPRGAVQTALAMALYQSSANIHSALAVVGLAVRAGLARLVGDNTTFLHRSHIPFTTL